MKPQGLKKIQDIRAQFLKQKFQDLKEIETQLNALQKQIEEGKEKRAIFCPDCRRKCYRSCSIWNRRTNFKGPGSAVVGRTAKIQGTIPADGNKQNGRGKIVESLESAVEEKTVENTTT